MILGAVKMMRFLYDNYQKLISKSGNLSQDFIQNGDIQLPNIYIFLSDFSY